MSPHQFNNHYCLLSKGRSRLVHHLPTWFKRHWSRSTSLSADNFLGERGSRSVPKLIENLYPTIESWTWTRNQWWLMISFLRIVSRLQVVGTMASRLRVRQWAPCLIINGMPCDFHCKWNRLTEWAPIRSKIFKRRSLAGFKLRRSELLGEGKLRVIRVPLG